MQAPDRHPFLRPRRLNSYLAYSVGCGLLWAALLAGAATGASTHAFHRLLLVFGGWALGWTSATIARLVYPPPRHRDWAGPRSFFQGFRQN
jgi:hypothetical protein